MKAGRPRGRKTFSPDSLWMTADEIAKRIDRPVSFVYQSAKAGIIPAQSTGIGRATRWTFYRAHVERWIADISGESRAA